MQQATTQEPSNNVERVVGQCGAEGEEKQTTINQIRGGDNLQKLLLVLCLLVFIEIIIILRHKFTGTSTNI
jgi:hypothetical protein